MVSGHEKGKESLMKKRIAFQLIAGFTGIVTVAVLIIGLIFIGLYQRAALDTKRDDMINRARNLAPLLSSYMDGSGTWRGLGSFFRMMDAVNDAQIWIIDSSGQVISLPGAGATGAGMPGQMGWGTQLHDGLSLNNDWMTALTDRGQSALPESALDMVQQILMGKEVSSEAFSDVYGQATLTIGVPVFTDGDAVLGGVLMHAPITAVNRGLGRAYGLLAFGLGAGFLAAIGLGIAYSERFTRPVRKMNQIAHAMAKGDYSVRTELAREDELGQLGDTLDHLAVSLGRAAEESNRLEQMRRDFIANVSHEFRTPLTVIRGSTEALLDGTARDPEEEKRRLHAILSETTGMNRLVGDLLELSRLESGRVSLEPEAVWPNEVLDDIWRGLSTVATPLGITLLRQLPESLAPVWADYGRFRQLMLIFLDNAVKHSPQNGVIAVSGQSVGKRVMLRIQDQGPGIPAEDLPLVWERFHTADKVRNRAGTGLGLSIARQLADLMGGTVGLESAPEKGTTAIIQLPEADVPQG
jgi:signal transduction histidine kinase